MFGTMSSTAVLLASALSIGTIHTLLGPDHYVPFVAMARVGGWSRRKTLVVTALCGLGHVAGSVILGLVGILFGLSLARLEAFESARGTWAAWALIVFGLVYLIWGLRRGSRHRRHGHLHAHADGTVHDHEHAHDGEHLHAHPSESGSKMTPWVLFVVFLLGPCEALIPLLMFPAATESWATLLLVTGTFGAATVGTMVALVYASLEGLERTPFPRIGRWGHALAGLTILLCGVAIEFMGL
jgi:ABC-type nickel/cobalt efflux system permease component RcnA